MGVWGRKETADATVKECYVLAAAAASGHGRRILKGYVPMVLVGDEGDDEEERILVHVRMLKEPCVAALLEMAAQQFGYGQQGVLRIPCNGRQFQQMVSLTCRAR